jgi:hypothetical protein
MRSMELFSPMLAQVVRAWRAARDGTPYPRRIELDAKTMGPAAHIVSILEVSRDPIRFKYRLHGAGTSRWVGFNLTGKFLDDQPDKMWVKAAADHLSKVVAKGLPSYQRHFNLAVGDRTINGEALVLPMATDGQRIDLLASVLVPHMNDAAWCAEPPRTEFITLNQDGEVAGFSSDYDSGNPLEATVVDLGPFRLGVTQPAARAADAAPDWKRFDRIHLLIAGVIEGFRPLAPSRDGGLSDGDAWALTCKIFEAVKDEGVLTGGQYSVHKYVHAITTAWNHTKYVAHDSEARAGVIVKALIAAKLIAPPRASGAEFTGPRLSHG